MSIIVFEGSHGSGKSTTINKMNDTYNLVSLKSVPDWYRKYIPFARSQKPEVQKEIYMIGHEANYMSLQKNKDYIMDRFFYTTIIRLNYELGKSPQETVSEILKISLEPTAIIFLRLTEEKIKQRLIQRNDIDMFDKKFFNYETEVFIKLSEIYDKMIIVDNNDTIDKTMINIDNALKNKKLYLKRR